MSGSETVRRKPGVRPTFATEDGRARLYVGDCRTVPGSTRWAGRGREQYTDGCANLIIADPPYNIGRDYGEDAPRDDLTTLDYVSFTHDWVRAMMGHLQDQGVMAIIIPDRQVWAVREAARANCLQQLNWIIWHYAFGQDGANPRRFRNSKAHVLVFARGMTSKDYVFNADRVTVPTARATTYADRRTQRRAAGNSIEAGRKVMDDVWKIPRVTGNSRERRPMHDNQLPELLVEILIEGFSLPGDTVFCPFVGSGTEGTLALALGRKFVGVEASPENARHAWERMTEIGPAWPLGRFRDGKH